VFPIVAWRAVRSDVRAVAVPHSNRYPPIGSSRYRRLEQRPLQTDSIRRQIELGSVMLAKLCRMCWQELGVSTCVE
jgi:hypothetical protein